MKFAKKQLSCVGCKVPIRYFAVPCLKIILGSCKLYAILDSRFLICICFYVFQVPYHLIVCSCNLVYLIPWDLLINFRFNFNQQWNTMRKLQGKRSRVVLQKCVTRYATIIPVSTDFLIYQEYLKISSKFSGGPRRSFWEAVDPVPGVSRLSSSRCVVHQVCLSFRYLY